MLHLETDLPDYDWYGVGRNDGADDGEFSAIFWRRGLFELEDSGTFWLSDTPDEPGSRHPDAASIRIASWVGLRRVEDDARWFVLNTHWDHVSQTAREFGGALIADRAPGLAADRPNILYLYVDDLGWGSIGPNGQAERRATGKPYDLANVTSPIFIAARRTSPDHGRGLMNSG